MKSTAVLLVALLAVASALSESEYRNAFVSFMRENRKVYKHDEFRTRYAIFKQNVDIIAEYNAKELGFTLKMNKFGDLTKDEFKKMYTGLTAISHRPTNVVELDAVNIPTSIDWRTIGAVTPVKNQGQCGSCWSFSSTGSLEGVHFIAKHSLLSFSEQQLVDCSGSFGNQGCNGGLMDQAFQYVQQNGIELEATYPYTAQDGTCQYKKAQVRFTNSGYKDVPQNNPTQLAAAVAQNPVSIAIEADQSCFQFYSGGILNDPSCGTQLDHGVLIVGYGTQGGQDFWIVKNSWGASWGEQGYIRIAKGSTAGPGICGINMMPSYPTA